MQCPQCRHETDYSWSVYAKNPLGRFTCNQCQARYQLVRPARYYVVALLYLTAYTGSAFALVYYGGAHFTSRTVFMATYTLHLLAFSGIWCFFDRRYEATLPTRLR